VGLFCDYAAATDQPALPTTVVALICDVDRRA